MARSCGTGSVNDKIVVLDADLAAATRQEFFKKVFPNAIDCGIAECNMMGIAAGLAATWDGSICRHLCNVRSR